MWGGGGGGGGGGRLLFQVALFMAIKYVVKKKQ